MTNPTESSYVLSISEFIDFLNEYTQQHNDFSKESVANVVSEGFSLSYKRPLYCCEYFAIRFSEASGSSFSNTVLSIRKLKAYDHIPLINCIVRPKSIELLLVNSTFIKKISHSSHHLRMDKLRGSFQGADILREYSGVSNTPSKFEELFLMHKEFTWEENLARLVEATNNIVPTGSKYVPTDKEKENIVKSSEISYYLASNPEYAAIGENLSQIVGENREVILKIGEIDNVNLRGNRIEQVITKASNFHGLEDLSYTLSSGSRVLVDIKTKILTLASSPKGYNIDKVLQSLGMGNTVFCFFFIGLDLESQTLSTRLLSILDSSILDATRIQFHWAGRNSRGVTQLTGNFSNIFSSDYMETVNIERAKEFLQSLVRL